MTELDRLTAEAETATANAAIAARLDTARQRGFWHPHRNDVDAALAMLRVEAVP